MAYFMLLLFRDYPATLLNAFCNIPIYVRVALLSTAAGIAFNLTHRVTHDDVLVLVNSPHKRIRLVRQPCQKKGPDC